MERMCMNLVDYAYAYLWMTTYQDFDTNKKDCAESFVSSYNYNVVTYEISFAPLCIWQARTITFM